MAFKSLKNDDGKWKFIGMSNYIVWPDHHIVYLIVSLISRFAILISRFRGWQACHMVKSLQKNNTKPTKRLLQTSWFQPSEGTHQKTPTILGHSLPRSSYAFPPLACAQLSCNHTPLSHKYATRKVGLLETKKTPLSTHNTTIILFIFQKPPLGQHNFGFRSVFP